MRNQQEVEGDMRGARQRLLKTFENVNNCPGQESFTVERGEFWMPAHLRVSVDDELDRLELRTISRVCDRWGLRVRNAPDSRHDSLVRLVVDREDRVELRPQTS